MDKDCKNKNNNCPNRGTNQCRNKDSSSCHNITTPKPTTDKDSEEEDEE